MTLGISTTERTMTGIARVGIDLAKKIFHVTAFDCDHLGKAA